MSGDIKVFRTRIKSVNSTLHLTKAMGLVAVSKINKANVGMKKSREYEKGLEKIIVNLKNCPECLHSAFLRNEKERTRLIVIAGDRGLAGGYNGNVLRFVKNLESNLNKDSKVVEIIPIGKRACDKFLNNKAKTESILSDNMKSKIVDLDFVSSEEFSVNDAYKLAQKQCLDFVENKYDRLGIVGTKYISPMANEVYLKWIFPLSDNKDLNMDLDTIPNKSISGIVFEPDEKTVFEAVAVEYTAAAINASVRESFACEVAARRMAMDSAGKNAKQMIDDLQLKYNRARQGAITQEITEIVAGSDN